MGILQILAFGVIIGQAVSVLVMRVLHMEIKHTQFLLETPPNTKMMTELGALDCLSDASKTSIP